MGDYLRTSLEQTFANDAGVKEVRGHGLMLGIELDRPCGALLNTGLERGLLFSVTADSVIRLVPPLNLTQADADEIIAILVPMVRDFLAA